MMSPAVYVYGTASLVFESSCGSGSAALGLSLAEGFQDGTRTYAIAQRGGLIETTVEKHAGALRRLSIGGPVTLSGRMHVRYEPETQS